MGKKKRVQDCRTGKDFLKYARKQEKKGRCEIRNGSGSHVIVKREGHGAMTIPVHANRQLGIGLRRVIAKWMIAAGLAGLLLLAVMV